jgi:hypothetical protein
MRLYFVSSIISLILFWNAEARLADALTGFDGSAQYALPPKLSLTGLYVNTASQPKVVSEAIVRFEVNTMLWTDGAHKERFITLPLGTTVIPTDSDHYVFPDRAVLVKNFLIDTIVGDQKSRIFVETRFLIARKIGTVTRWLGVTYAWRRDQTEADLVNQLEGLNSILSVQVGGILKGKRWHYPSKGECLQCHSGRGALGFITPQLNRPPFGQSTGNQLQELVTQGILSANNLSSNPKTMKWATLEDSTASLELRSRSYLAANCSHCHGNQNFVGPTHSFDFLNPNVAFTYDKADPFAEGPYVGKPSNIDPTMPKLAYPGFPDSSFLMKRMLSRGTFDDINAVQMPPLGTYQPDSMAIKIIAAWLCTLGQKNVGACKLPAVPKLDYWETGIHQGRHANLQSGIHVNLRGKVLKLIGLPALTISGQSLTLTNIQGRCMVLQRIRQDEWTLPSDLSPGVYTLHVNGSMLSLNLGW